LSRFVYGEGQYVCELHGMIEPSIYQNNSLQKSSQQFKPDRTVIAHDVSILLQLSGLDVLYDNAFFPSPFQQRTTDIFRPITNPDGSLFFLLFNDPTKVTYGPFG